MSKELEIRQNSLPDETIEVLSGEVEPDKSYFKTATWRDFDRLYLHIRYSISDEWFHRCSREQHDRLNKLLLGLRDLGHEPPQN